MSRFADQISVQGRARLVAWGLAGLLLLLPGCNRQPPKVQPPEDGKTTGLLLVGAPKVFARERLIRDREEQRKWLEGQLKRAESEFDAFQGAIQTRSLQQTSTTFGLDATAAGALSIRSSEAEAENLQRAQEIADLEHRIKVAGLEAQLESARSGGIQAIAIPNTTGTGGTTGSAGSTDGGASSSGSGADGTSGNGTSGSAAGGASGAAIQLPSTEIAALSVKDRPIDRFRDRLAYREEVRQELLDNDLDDAHDLLGRQLLAEYPDQCFVADVVQGDQAQAHQHLRGDSCCSYNRISLTM